jgi:hypothetical protein
MQTAPPLPEPRFSPRQTSDPTFPSHPPPLRRLAPAARHSQPRNAGPRNASPEIHRKSLSSPKPRKPNKTEPNIVAGQFHSNCYTLKSKSIDQGCACAAFSVSALSREQIPQDPANSCIQRTCRLNLWNQYFAATLLPQAADSKDRGKKGRGERVPRFDIDNHPP